MKNVDVEDHGGEEYDDVFDGNGNDPRQDPAYEHLNHVRTEGAKAYTYKADPVLSHL
jgi:hypothetical protein